MVVLALVAMYFGVDPRVVLQQGGNLAGPGAGGRQSTSYTPSPQEARLADFVSVILADTEQTWSQIFKARGWRYEEPKLVLFSGSVKSACGMAQAAMGPFYCPGDHKVYIDLAFYRELKERHHAPGDFAQAYVIAHEIGHHVQNLLGVSSQVRRAQRRMTKKQANALSVRVELQADCYAGVWANNAHRDRHLLEEGDVEEGLNAASAIGDDRLQKEARGYVTPDSFTHGTSSQRVKWFRIGLREGDIDACDTFDAAQL